MQFQKVSIHTTGRSVEIPRGLGVSKCTGLNWNFPEGWGDSNQKHLPWEGYGYFLEQQFRTVGFCRVRQTRVPRENPQRKYRNQHQTRPTHKCMISTQTTIGGRPAFTSRASAIPPRKVKIKRQNYNKT